MDDDFGSFEDAVTGTEEDLQPAAAGDQSAESKANGSKEFGDVDRFTSFASAQSKSSNPDDDANGGGGGLPLSSPEKKSPAPVPPFETDVLHGGGSVGDECAAPLSLPSPGKLPEAAAESTVVPKEDVVAGVMDEAAGAGKDEKEKDGKEDPPPQVGAVTATPGVDGDPFGAFDSIPAFKTEPVGSALVGAGSKGGCGGGNDGDPFAAFDTSGGGLAEPPALSGIAAAPEEALAAAANRSETEDGAAATLFKQEENDVLCARNDDDEFGSFDDAVMVEPTLQEDEAGAPVDDCNNTTGTTAPEKEEEARTGTISGENEKKDGETDADKGVDDDFGDFDAFEDVATASPASLVAAAEPATELADAFEAREHDIRSSRDKDFESSPVAGSTLASPVEEPRAKEDLVDALGGGDDGEKNECDNSGLSSDGPAETAPTTKKGAHDEFASNKTHEEEAALEGADDDDFGDFGSFKKVSSESHHEHAVATVDVAKEKESTEEGHAAARDSVDDLGDFGSFNDSNNEPAQTTTEKATEAFTERTDKVEAGLQQVGGGDKVQEDEDDAFGGFEDAVDPPEHTRVEKDKPSAELAQPLGSADKEGGDDFGDFGDFDDAPAAAVPAEEDEPSELRAQPSAADQAEDDDDDFGDFGDFDKSEAVPEIPPDDPFVAKSRAVLGRVFGGFAVDYAFSDPPTDEDGDMGSSTLESLLSSIAGATSDKGEDLWSKGQVESILNDLEQDLPSSPPSVISNHDVPRPYAHYAIPICGLHVSDDESPTAGGRAEGGEACAQERGDNAHGYGRAKPTVPKVLSINLPTGPESPPPPRKPKPVALSGREAATVVALPPVRGKEQENDAVERGAKLASSGAANQNGEERDSKNGDGSDFGANFGGFESTEHPSVAAATDDSGDVSAACKDFLQQIPDLSFMLKSSLSLPGS